jgi:hypothetical protein
VRTVRTFAGYLFLFALLALPWLRHAAESIPISSIHSRGDTRLLTWILWWVADALTHQPSALLDAPINYPAPAQLTGSEHFAALQLIFLPIFVLTKNPVLGLNAVLFVSYPLAALAMNRLLRALGASGPVAWTMGLVYALGALQAPAHVHLLHTLAFFPPLVALALRRLRERTDARRTAILAVLLVLAVFAAYYTAALVMVVVALWSVAELMRPLPGRTRYAGAVAASTATALGLLLLASQAYLARAAMVDPAESAEVLRTMSSVVTAQLLDSPVSTFGLTALLAAAAGCLAVRDARLRGPVLIGLALIVTSVLLITGVTVRIGEALPSAHGATPLAFFRVVIRWSVLTGFGLALLGAAALELARNRLAPRAALAFTVLVALAATAERGRVLFTQPLDQPLQTVSEMHVYRAVAAIVAHDGGGPLLELPLSSMGRSLQPEAMLGAIAHRQPLIVGHTGYQPAHRPELDRLIRRLPSEDAVQQIVDRTRLRWVLVRPASYWGDPHARRRLVDGLVALPDVHAVGDLGDWTILMIERTPRNDETFRVLASKPSETLPDGATATAPVAVAMRPPRAR